MPGESREAGEAGLGAMSPAEAFTLLISSPSRTRTGDRASRLRRHQNHQRVTSGRPGNAAAQGELGVPVQEYRGLTEPGGCNINAYQATAPTRGREQE